MKTSDFDWSYFKRRIYIKNTTKQELFRKWTTAQGITGWFIEFALYKNTEGRVRAPEEIVQSGDTYSWRFHVGTVVNGVIIEVKENSLVKFTFGKKEPDSDEDVLVTVTFHEDNDQVWFDLLQENMSESKYGRVNYYISCNMGWVFHMNNLKSILETGHDLRIISEQRMHVDAPSGYPLEDFHWTHFSLNEYIKAPKEVLFRKWTTSRGITEWFLVSAEYRDDNGLIRGSDEIVSAGDSYTWTFFAGLTITGTVLEVKRNSRFKFTFGKKEPDSDEDVVVTVSFQEQNDLVQIAVFQENIAENEYGSINYTLSCHLGWSYFLTNLRSIYESGYDLREKDKERAKISRAYTL